MKRVLSKYISEYELDDRMVGLFNSVFLTKAFIDQELWTRVKESTDFKGISAEERKNLEYCKMIIEEGEDERRLAELAVGSGMSPVVETMYLFLSNSCNMRCRYCIVDKESAQAETGSFMTEETVDKALRLFLENAEPERLRILLWGGEPLINWRVFKYAVEQARELERQYSKNLRIATVTNGTLLTKEIAEHLGRNKVDCSISIDGLEDQHDKMRIYPNGSGTYRDIRNNLSLLKDAGVRFGVSLTVGSHNVDLLPEVASVLCDELEIKKIGAGSLMNVDTANPAYTDDEGVAGQLIEMFKRLSEEGISEDTMTRNVVSFAFEEERLHGCAAAGGQIAVMPNGDIGLCHYAATVGKWIIGNVEGSAEDLFNSKDMAEWTRRSPINMPRCQECPGLVMCGGGCPYEAYQKSGDLWALDERFCTHCKGTIKWMMEELYKAQGCHRPEKSAEWRKMLRVVAYSRFIHSYMPSLRSVPEATVTDEELQQCADAFRRGEGLTSAAATEDWMSRHGITVEFFEEFLRGAILYVRLKDLLAKGLC